MKMRIVVATIVAIMLIPVFAFSGDVIFIGNKDVSEAQLSKLDIKYIYLGKKRVWNNNRKVVFATQQRGALQDSFLKQFMGKTAFQFDNYWKKQVFTGKSAPPKIFKSDEEIIKFVSETSGAIGYVSPGANLENVKTISVD